MLVATTPQEINYKFSKASSSECTSRWWKRTLQSSAKSTQTTLSNNSAPKKVFDTYKFQYVNFG